MLIKLANACHFDHLLNINVCLLGYLAYHVNTFKTSLGADYTLSDLEIASTDDRFVLLIK